MTQACPLCKKPTVFDFRPFCSKRCADLDLARWFRGDYRIEACEEDKEETPHEEETDL